MSDARAEYQQRLRRWRARIGELDRRHLTVSNARLAAVAAAAILLWLALRQTHPISLAWCLMPIGVFAALVFVHQRVIDRADRARRAERWYVRALDRLDDRWASVARDGARFLDDQEYARDLDLFGDGSLFQLLNTASTEIGETTLAEWLQDGAAIDEVRARQGAVEELRSHVDFREGVAMAAAGAEASRTGALARWAGAPPVGYPGYAPWLFGACALVFVGLVAAAYQGVLPVTLAIGWLFVEAILVWVWRRSFHGVVDRVGRPVHDLESIAELIAAVEAAHVDAPRLRGLQSALTEHGKASREIARLSGLVSLLESSTHNLFFRPITMALLVPEQLAIAIDRWHQRHGRAAIDWLRAVGELESLSALATYAYEHHTDPFPVLDDEGPLFDAEGLGHPLMPEKITVRNDVKLGGDGSARAARQRLEHVRQEHAAARGRHQRRAGAGGRAGPRRRRCVCRRSPLGATLRIDDSLQEGQSRFYAEIVRDPRASSNARAAPRRCCSCSTRSCTAPTRTTAASAPRPSSGRSPRAAPSASSPRTTSRWPRCRHARRRAPPTCTSRIDSRTAAWSSTTACAPASSNTATPWRSCAQSDWTSNQRDDPSQHGNCTCESMDEPSKDPELPRPPDPIKEPPG